MHRSSRGAFWAVVTTLAACAAACSSSSGVDGDGTDGGPQAGAAGASGATGSGASGTSGTIGSGGTVDNDGAAGAASDEASAMVEGGCGQSTITATSKPVNVLLVIDRSGSMTSKPTGFSTDKWSAMKSAITSVVHVKDISFGLELFPNSLTMPIPTACADRCWEVPPGDSAVVVPVVSGDATVAAVTSKLEITPTGGTPTAKALRAAYEYYVSGAGKSLSGDRYVLLATDGGPNGATGLTCDRTGCTSNIDRGDLTSDKPNYCDASLDPHGPLSCLDTAGTVTELTALANAGIKTFVVGIPGSEPYVPALDQFAVAGGAPKSATSPRYYAVTADGAEGLSATFTSIAKHLITTCNLQLQSNPPDLSRLNVTVDGNIIAQAGPDGWDLDTTTSPPTVVLKGATCTAIQTNGAQSVQILFGCPTVTVN